MRHYKIGATDPYSNNAISFTSIVWTHDGKNGPLVNMIGFLTLLYENTGFHIYQDNFNNFLLLKSLSKTMS
jgi:hypothetical protein